MKKNLLSIALFVAIAASGQTYNLSSTVVVGCPNANPVADVTKKIDLVLENGSAKIILKSLICSKELNGQKIVLDNGAISYLDSKEKKGVILTSDNRVALITENGGKFGVAVGGHLDKKEAKNVTTESLEQEFSGVLSKMPEYLKKAQEEAELAAMRAKMLQAPNLSLSDNMGISGKYYISEPLVVSSSNREIDGKYVEAVYIHWDDAERTFKAYLTESSFDKWFLSGSRFNKAYKEGKIKNITFLSNDNMNNVKAFRNSLTKLEDGVYMLGGFIASEALSGELKTHVSEKYIILGKDKNRVEELAKDPRQVERLGSLGTIEFDRLSNALLAAEKPMPAPSAMNTPKLKAEATELSKAFSKGRWAQEVQYAYIVGKEWYTIRNSLTGIITGRAIAAIVVMKEKDGSYKWEEISIRQDYNGNDFGQSYFGGETTILVPVESSNALKYK